MTGPTSLRRAPATSVKPVHRRYLLSNVREIGQAKDYVGECLRNSDDQYNRALQDLVNRIGAFLELDIGFGRYCGVAGEIGYDGHWKSATGFRIMAECGG